MSADVKAKITERLAYLDKIIADPMSEPETSSYTYEHRVQASELRRVLGMFT